MDNDWKKRLGVIYSTDREYEYAYNNEKEATTLPARQQDLRISLDKKQRKGKKVTIISGFIGKEEDLKSLSKFLKSKCGVGGSVKEGDILLQGDLRQKVREILEKNDYKVKLAGGH
ncbi:MAG: translation initiation factor [Bacteroidales bacterium]|nr:translation initiation factor [Bacteroidales bacterium]